MTRKLWYLVPVAIASVVGFAIGHRNHAEARTESRKVLYYVDPMHPSYRSDRPGTAPDCGMDLVPVYADGVGKVVSSMQGDQSSGLSVDASAQQLYGIQLSKAQSSSGKSSLHAFGRVEADQTRIFRINLGVEGYIKDTENDAVGDRVKKNQHLATVYSPDFLAVAGGYLSANERTPTSSKDNPAVPQNAASAQARADRLRNLGMSEVQIEEMTSSRKIPEDVYVVAPTDGIILTRNIAPGMRFEKEREFYTIADLSHVWIMAEVFGEDAAMFKPGTIARLKLPDTGETFQARVSQQLPEVDSTSRVLKVRLEAVNPGLKLRPNMFVDIDVPVSLPAGLSVPSEAIVNSGSVKQVFVQTSPGNFERRTVETGWSMDGRVQILKGLSDGETVVSQGAFLVDSESRLQAANNAAAPSDPKQDQAKMQPHGMN